ncbi:MAG: hypothetical protein QX195_06245 [Methylococcaceae bacterium]
MIELQPNQRVLDVCAGTNAIGIAVLKRKPSLKIPMYGNSHYGHHDTKSLQGL